MTLRPAWLAGAFLGALAIHAVIFLQFDAPEDRGEAPDGNEGILVALGAPAQTGAGGEDEVDQNPDAEPNPDAAPPEPLVPETAALEPEQPDDPVPESQVENTQPEATSVEIPVDAISEATEAEVTEPVPEPASEIAASAPDQAAAEPPRDVATAPERFDPPLDAGLAAAPLPESRPEHAEPPAPAHQPAAQNSQNTETRRSVGVAEGDNTNTQSEQARTGGGNDAERADYLTRLHSQLVRSRRYPQSARRDNIEGVVQIGLTINRVGRVTAFQITRGSGFDILDEEVRNMIDRVQPLPRMPDSMELSQITINMAIRFKLE